MKHVYYNYRGSANGSAFIQLESNFANFTDLALDWFRKFTFYLWQFPDDLLDQLVKLRNALQLKDRYIGVHVRRGDKKIRSTSYNRTKFMR